MENPKELASQSVSQTAVSAVCGVHFYILTMLPDPILLLAIQVENINF